MVSLFARFRSLHSRDLSVVIPIPGSRDAQVNSTNYRKCIGNFHCVDMTGSSNGQNDIVLKLLRKNNEEVLRNAMKNEAKENCKQAFVDFGQCAEYHGILVVLQCREKSKASKYLTYLLSSLVFIRLLFRKLNTSPSHTFAAMRICLYIVKS